MVFEEESKLKSIERGVFSECRDLEKISVPDGLVSIGDEAFRECANLKSIRFSNVLEKIGAVCFWKGGLEEIVLPASVKEVGAGAFYECR